MARKADKSAVGAINRPLQGVDQDLRFYVRFVVDDSILRHHVEYDW